MAKDDDIVESMFGMVVSLIGWIFKALFNVFLWLIKGIWSLLVLGFSALFTMISKKRKEQQIKAGNKYE